MMELNGISLIIMVHKQKQFLLQDFRLLLHQLPLKLVWVYLQELEIKEPHIQQVMKYG